MMVADVLAEDGTRDGGYVPSLLPEGVRSTAAVAMRSLRHSYIALPPLYRASMVAS